MQWWRDAVAEIYNQAGDEDLIQSLDGGANSRKADEDRSWARGLSVSSWHSPVVRALSRAVREHNLTRRFLERLINIREIDLDVYQYRTMQDMVQYSEESVSSLLYLSLETVDVRNDQADRLAYHAGVGIGLTTSLRSTPFRLLYGEIPIPADLLRPGFPYHQLVVQDRSDTDGSLLMTLSSDDAALWDNAVRQVVHEAMIHWNVVRDHQYSIVAGSRRRISNAKKSIILPMIPSVHFISKLQKANYNLFAKSSLIDATPLPLLLLLGRTWATGVF
jgi:NADH dehydrogenase [ubiquinone] 1 alpha subcomplex assembly factor 6